MAIDPKAKTLRQYKQYYYRHVTLILLAANTCVIIGLATTLYLTDISSIFQFNFWITILVAFILGIVSSIVIVKIITAPLSKILAALSHKIGEPTINIMKKLALKLLFKQFMMIASQQKSLQIKLKTLRSPKH